MIEKLEKPVMVTKSFLPPFEEYINEIEDIWDTSWLTNMGPKHEKLKEEMKKYLKVENISLMTNGHLALEIAIKALELEGEVITTPFTFASTTHAIVNCGLKPVFCDISLEDYNIDVTKIEGLITEETSAILAVHVFGNPCNVEKIEELAKKYNLKVIYDAAHAFGVQVKDKGIGSFGTISMFSLHATKVFNSIEGGVLTYQNKDLSRKIRLLKNFGITGPESVEEIGSNAKMNEFQASMGLVNLKYIESEIKKRKIITERYKKRLLDFEGVKFLKLDKENFKYNYSYLPILIDENILKITRDQLYVELQKYNIFTRKYFYPLTTDFECYKNRFNTLNLNNAKYISDRILTLPIYGGLELDIVDKICEVIKGVCEA